MNLKQKVDQIKQLEAIETPYDVLRVFGKLELWGGQVCVVSDCDRDYVDLAEFRDALKWLVEQSGGYIIWDEDVKERKPRKQPSTSR